MKYVDVKTGKEPPSRRRLVCYCPEWCESMYQVAEYRNGEFYYEDQPNDMFNDLVVAWALLVEYE